MNALIIIPIMFTMFLTQVNRGYINKKLKECKKKPEVVEKKETISKNASAESYDPWYYINKKKENKEKDGKNQ